MGISNEETLDFIDRVNELLRKKEIRTRRELVDKLDWNETALSGVMNGNRPVPRAKYEVLRSLYGFEKSRKNEETEIILLRKENAELKKKVEMLESWLADKQAIIEAVARGFGKK